MKELLKDLVGLSDYAPNCELTDITNEEITASKSGYFVLGIDNLNLLEDRIKSDCTKKSIFYLLKKAKKNAILDFETDLLQAISLNRKNKYRTLKFRVGTNTFSGSELVKQGGEVKVIYDNKHVVNGYMKISKIGLIVTATTQVVVSASFLKEPITIDAIEDTESTYTFNEPILVDLGSNEEIYVSYVANGFLPRKNTLSCGCGGNDALVGEFYLNNLSESAKGVTLYAEFGCNLTEAVIEEIEGSDDLKKVTAKAFQYKILELAVEGILNTGETSRYTMMEPEHLFGKRNNYRKEYKDRISYLASLDGLQFEYTSCIECKQSGSIGRMSA